MTQLKRYVAKVVAFAILTVLLVIVSLDAISGLVDQLGDFRKNYDFFAAIFYVLLYIPSSVYDYLPLSILIGCLVGLGVLASSSELVVMRAAGVSVSRIIWLVMRPSLVFIVLGALIGEFVAPYTDQYADSRKALAQGHQSALQSKRGVWNREGDEYMHFNAVLPNGKLYGITRYRFAENGKLVEASFVDSAIFQGDYWFEQDGIVTHFAENRVWRSEFATRRWRTEVSPALLNVLVLEVDALPMQRLHTYAAYLKKQNVDASEYRLAFWQKALQPLATASLVMIAISFILGPLRQVTMGFRVFAGVLVGLIFQTSQKLLGPTSIILGFPPMFAVLIPIIVCVFFGWFLLWRAR